MNNTQLLAKFVADTTYQDIPHDVIDGMQRLCLDWFGSAISGKEFYPIDIFREYAKIMGPVIGKSTILGEEEKTSPYFAALVNGASGHLLEQDDLHNSSVFHPGTVVFPALFAAAEDLKASGEEILLAAVMGYEAGIRIGEFLGRSHYRIFHTTSTVGSISAAIAVGKLMNFDQKQVLNLIGNAATQSAGLWAFLEDAADSKQLHTAKANANGILAAYMTRAGLNGACNALEGIQGLGRGMSLDANPSAISDRLGERWASLETSFKYHASCRHTHPAGDALLVLMDRENIQHQEIESVITYVHQAAIDVLGSVICPSTVHQAKFSMGTVLGLLAVHGRAGLFEFKKHALNDENVLAFRDKVSMILDPEVDKFYPKQWQGKVKVKTNSGQTYEAFICYPKGDPENALSKEELENKFKQLIEFSGNKKLIANTDVIIDQLWRLNELKSIATLMAMTI